MPVEIPDSRVHEYCHSCKQWFEPEDGIFKAINFGGPVAKLRKFGDTCMGKDRSTRFVCHDCVVRREKRTKVIAIVIVFLALAFTMAAAVFTLIYIGI